MALAVSVAATPLVRAAAVRWGLGDKPNGRSSRTGMIPHLGGIAMFLGVAVAVVALGRGRWLAGIGSPFVKASPALFTILVLGLVDDMRSIRARHKLVVQFIAAAMLIAVGFRLFTGVVLFDAATVLLGALSLVFFVGMLSSVNLIDGHDGLAGGVSLLAAAALATIGFMVGASGVIVVSLAVCGACLGFLFFNFPPGRIYMGDTGSMMLGLVLALVACMLTMRAPSPNMFVAVCFALGVPLLDTVLAIARRVVLRSPVFAADTLHMHHVLRDGGLSPRRTLMVLWGMQLFFSLLGIGAAAGWVLPVIVGLGFVTVAFVTFLRAMVEDRVSPESRPIPVNANTIPFQSTFTTGLQEHRTSVGR
jgi:UDP-GlcNAc:undecaprenyl-phosphate/decaprenyl-phosphate GlcNAc-1-phosphate transferase